MDGAKTAAKALGKRIRQLREAHDLSQEAFAEKLGVKRGAVGNWELGKGIKRQNLERISDRFEAPFEWLSRGVGAAPDINPVDAGNEETIAALSTHGRHNVTSGEIPQIAARLGLGHSTDEPTINIPIGSQAIAAVPVIAMWKVPESVLRRRTSGALGRLHIVECEGDSMEPTIRNGDLAFIDASRRMPSPPGIFAIHDGFGQTLKRLEVVPNSEPPKVLIIPDNPKHHSYERLLDEINIIGRYVCRLTAD